jgi:hypothetical protein
MGRAPYRIPSTRRIELEGEASLALSRRAIIAAPISQDWAAQLQEPDRQKWGKIGPLGPHQPMAAFAPKATFLLGRRPIARRRAECVREYRVAAFVEHKEGPNRVVMTSQAFDDDLRLVKRIEERAFVRCSRLD